MTKNSYIFRKISGKIYFSIYFKSSPIFIKSLLTIGIEWNTYPSRDFKLYQIPINRLAP